MGKTKPFLAYMKSTEQIVKIIEEAIKENPKIGFIYNDKLYMQTTNNAYINEYNLYLIIPFILLFVFGRVLTSRIFFLILTGYFIFLLILQCFLYLTCYHYIVFDYNNNQFYTVSLLFNYFEFASSSYIKDKEIKKVCLTTFLKNDDVGIYNKEIFDRISFLTSDTLRNEEINFWLDGIYKYRKIHNTLMKRCKLLSECLDKEFIYEGDQAAIKAEIAVQNGRRGCLLFFALIFTFNVAAFIIYLLFYR